MIIKGSIGEKKIFYFFGKITVGAKRFSPFSSAVSNNMHMCSMFIRLFSLSLSLLNILILLHVKSFSCIKRIVDEIFFEQNCNRQNQLCTQHSRSDDLSMDCGKALSLAYLQ